MFDFCTETPKDAGHTSISKTVDGRSARFPKPLFETRVPGRFDLLGGIDKKTLILKKKLKGRKGKLHNSCNH